MQEDKIDNRRNITIVEILDRVLTKGVVISGDVVISVADIDLVYLGIRLMLSSVETIEQLRLQKIKDINSDNSAVNSSD
ncbi:MAG: gas vesicle protein [Ignavibacteriae bacterium]|nr:gas vesicle protein [Ignavibacteriota bacterium]